MKVFFVGKYIENSGPCNVNRALINAADKRLMYLHEKSKPVMLLEAIKCLKSCDIVVISGICSEWILRLIRLYKKKYLYILHGDLIYENEINKEKIPKRVLNTQWRIFRETERIICVSEKYAQWVQLRYPLYKKKITFVNNGLSVSLRKKVSKEPYSIAIAGANRPIKANKFVCEAVKILQQQGLSYKVYVFGRKYANCDELPEIENLQYMGHIDKEEYYECLDKISIFVINSDVESFGLTVGDAINCNCSLLMSSNIGAISIFNTCDEDIIHNNHDANEIAQKIQHIMGNPNSERLYNSLKLKYITTYASYERLMNLCECILGS